MPQSLAMIINTRY